MTYDPFCPVADNEDLAILDQLREASSVSSITPDTYLVAGYAEVSQVLGDSRLYAQGGLGGVGKRADIDECQLGELDPPFHAEVRRYMARAMAPRRLARFEPIIRELADEQVAEVRAAGRNVDLVEDFAMPLTARVAARLGGMSDQDVPAIRSFTADFITSLSEPDTEHGRAAALRCDTFEERFLHVISRRREDGPSDPPDLLDALLECTDGEGRPLSKRRLLTHFSKDVIAGGIDTTAFAIANFLYLVLQDPAGVQRLREEPEGRARAIEESLRLLGSVTFVLRTTTADAELGGEVIPAGSKIVLSLTAANRDQKAFAAPDVFDPANLGAGRVHLGFGKGIHHCVGAPQARLVLKCALDALLDSELQMTLDNPDRYHRVWFSQQRGLKSLPVTVSPASEEELPVR